MSMREKYINENKWDYNACLKLGNAIIEQAGRDYCFAYINGDKATYDLKRFFLKSEYASMLTAYTTDTNALLEKLDKRLFKEYGAFEDRVREREKELAQKRKLHELAKKYRSVNFIFVVDNKYVASINAKGLVLVDDYNDKRIRHRFIKYDELAKRLKDKHIKFKTIKESEK